MRVRMPIILTALAALLVAVPLVSAKPAPRATPGTLLIGFEGPLSGGQQGNGYDMLRGTKLAVREINRAGGVLGLKLRLVAVDDRANATTGVKAANTLIAKNPYAVIGPYNSSVGVKTLPLYEKAGVLPVQLTSTDDTTGMGVTVQPKNSQISPVEVNWMIANEAEKVAILWDPSTYTKGMADRLAASLTKKGVLVSKIEIDPSKTDFTDVVDQALTDNPDTVYVSTYYPQGALIAKALKAEADQGNDARCFMGLANQDPGFIEKAKVPAASRCVFSGTPTPTQFANPQAKAYVTNYESEFGKTAGTWGIYTYDSVYTLVAAIKAGGAIDIDATTAAILKTKNLAGATGPITIAPKTGNRPNVPIAILGVNGKGQFTLKKVYT